MTQEEFSNLVSEAEKYDYDSEDPALIALQ